jgi:hypothetical protein
MGLKERLRTLTARQWLLLFVVSVALEIAGRILTRELGPLATEPWMRLALDAFGYVVRSLPATVVGAAVVVGPWAPAQKPRA